MAKKKTAGSDNPTAATPAAAPKRRTGAKRSDAAADDRSAALAGGNGHSDTSPSYEEIAEAAYQRYLSRGGQHGRDFDDWVEAERELRARQ